MIHDEDDVLTDNELVVVRDLKKTQQNMHAYIYKINFLVGLSC